MESGDLKGIRADDFLRYFFYSSVFIFGFLLNFHSLTGVDTFWLLKTGEVIFESWRVPRVDIYSFTVWGREWIDSQWLFQLIMYLVYRAGGFRGLVIFGAVLTGLIWGLILKESYSRRNYILISVLLLFSLITSSSRFRVRPEVMSYFLLSLEIFLIQGFRRGRMYYVYFLLALLVFWVNIEGLWPIYFVVLGCFILEDILLLPGLGLVTRFNIRNRGSGIKKAIYLMVCGIVSGLLTFINPYGYRGVLFPLRLFEEVSSRGSFVGKFIYDLKGPVEMLNRFDLTVYAGLILLCFILILICILRMRIYFATIILWGLFLYLSITAVRNVALFGIASGALIGRMVSENEELFAFGGMNIRSAVLRLRDVVGLFLICFICFLFWDIVTSRYFFRNYTYARFGAGTLEITFPFRGMNFLRGIYDDFFKGRGFKIFSDMASAGSLIWEGHPDWKLYFDPRLELYGEEFVERYARLISDFQEFDREDSRYDFDIVVIYPSLEKMGMISEFYQSKKWALVYMDGASVIFFKKKEEFSKVLEKYQIEFQKGYKVQSGSLRGKWLGLEKEVIGYLYFTFGEYELSVGEFKEALRYNPEKVALNFNLGRALNFLGRYDESEIYLERAKKGARASADVAIELSRSYLGKGKIKDGIFILEDFLKRFPGEIKVCIELAKVYDKFLRDDIRGREQMNRCLRVYESNPKLYDAYRLEIFDFLKR